MGAAPQVFSLTERLDGEYDVTP